MSAFDLVVHLRETSGEPLVARAACMLGKTLQAYVYGLYVAPLGAVAFSTPETVVFQVNEADRLYNEAITRREWWQGVLSAGGCPGEWLVAQGETVEALCHAARWCDLVVASHPLLNADAPTGWGTVSRTVFGAGAPVVVVPDGMQLTTLGTRVLIAWNQSREAMRAVHGALPLLAKAQHITVLDGEAQHDRLGARHLPTLDLRAYLRRHGIAADFHTFAPKQDPGAALLASAHEQQADLIVMGAWGHSRIAELVLGGVTRYMFQHSDLPLLVAH